MSEQNNKQNARLVTAVIIGIAVLAIGLGAIFYINSDNPQAGALVDSALSPSDLPLEGAPPVETPVDETDSSASEELEQNVAVDVDAFVATRAIGNPDAPVKIVEYASLTCSHCAHFHNDILPSLKSKYIDTGKVYLEFREFPLNDPALKATLTARCLPTERYDSFVGLLFETQDKWANNVDYMNTLRQNAKLAGLSDEMFDACQNAPALKLKIAEQMQEAQDKYKISSTPTFIINGGEEVIQGAQPLENFERAFRAVTNNEVGEAPAVE